MQITHNAKLRDILMRKRKFTLNQCVEICETAELDSLRI